MRLLKRIMLRSRLRRMACMKWLPPIERPSPSPVTTHTERSGFEAVRVHVVGEARRAAYPRDEDYLLARDAEVGHDLLYAVQYRVVAAARAPAHLLVGGEVGLRHLDRRRRGLARGHRPRLALGRRPAARDVSADALRARFVHALLQKLFAAVSVSVAALSVGAHLLFLSDDCLDR